MAKKTIDRGLPAQKKRQKEFLKSKSETARKTAERFTVPTLSGQQQTAQKESIRSR
jgi:hypothetical protein